MKKRGMPFMKDYTMNTSNDTNINTHVNDMIVHYCVTTLHSDIMEHLYQMVLNSDENIGKVLKIDSRVMDGMDIDTFEQRVLECVLHELHHTFNRTESEMNDMFKFKIEYIEGE